MCTWIYMTSWILYLHFSFYIVHCWKGRTHHVDLGHGVDEDDGEDGDGQPQQEGARQIPQDASTEFVSQQLWKGVSISYAENTLHTTRGEVGLKKRENGEVLGKF